MPLQQTLQRSLALFWCINALLFFLQYPAPGAPSLPAAASLVAGVVCLFFGGGSLSSKYWLTLAKAQMCWLLAEPILLASRDLYYLVHPLGLCSKNIPIILLILITQREATREQQIKWGRTAVAIVWLTEGILPKMLFQQEMELSIAVWFFQGVIAPSLSLYLIGAAQVSSAILSLLLHPALAGLILIAQLFGLILLPALVLLYDIQYALFLFAPLFKNIPIFAATYWLVRHTGGPHPPLRGSPSPSVEGEGRESSSGVRFGVTEKEPN